MRGPAAGAGNITDQETIDALRKSNAGNLQARAALPLMLPLMLMPMLRLTLMCWLMLADAGWCWLMLTDAG